MLISTHAFLACIFSRVTYAVHGSTFIPASILNAEKKHSPDLSGVSDSKLRRQRLRNYTNFLFASTHDDLLRSVCLRISSSSSTAPIYISLFLFCQLPREGKYMRGIKQRIGKVHDIRRRSYILLFSTILVLNSTFVYSPSFAR